jgi:Sugar (and other) transporter
MAHKKVAALSEARLRGARFVYIAALFAALGGLLFGYDTGVISGVLIFVKREFGLTTATEEIVVSGVLLGATIGAIFGGKSADLDGRDLSVKKFADSPRTRRPPSTGLRTQFRNFAMLRNPATNMR